MALASEKPTSYPVTVAGLFEAESKSIGGTAMLAGGRAGGTQRATWLEQTELMQVAPLTQSASVVQFGPGGAVPASAASCTPLASTLPAPSAPLLPRPAKIFSLVSGGNPTLSVISLKSSSPAMPSEM